MKQDDHITPAALAALASRDFENFLVASTPGGIERQEAMGQSAFVGTRDGLPLKGLAEYRPILEKFGVTFGEPIDDLFVHAALPAGWKKRATDHNMWSHLLDSKGRKRASIFYKAAFYDRDAFLNLENRYGIASEYPNQESGDYAIRRLVVKDFATGAVLFDAGTGKSTSFEDPMRDACKSWLDIHKPRWEDPASYWDE